MSSSELSLTLASQKKTMRRWATLFFLMRRSRVCGSILYRAHDFFFNIINLLLLRWRFVFFLLRSGHRQTARASKIWKSKSAMVRGDFMFCNGIMNWVEGALSFCLMYSVRAATYRNDNAQHRLILNICLTPYVRIFILPLSPFSRCPLRCRAHFVYLRQGSVDARRAGLGGPRRPAVLLLLGPRLEVLRLLLDLPALQNQAHSMIELSLGGTGAVATHMASNIYHWNSFEYR